jgi:hypothetical protein
MAMFHGGFMPEPSTLERLAGMVLVLDDGRELHPLPVAETEFDRGEHADACWRGAPFTVGVRSDSDQWLRVVIAHADRYPSRREAHLICRALGVKFIRAGGQFSGARPRGRVFLCTASTRG